MTGNSFYVDQFIFPWGGQFTDNLWLQAHRRERHGLFGITHHTLLWYLTAAGRTTPRASAITCR